MHSLQIIAILLILAAHVVLVYFASGKFTNGWLKVFFTRAMAWEKGTDMGLTTVRFVIIIEAIIAFVVVNAL